MRAYWIKYGLYFLLWAGVLYYILGPVIDAPEHFVFGLHGDGLKNYFTLTHYVRHDHGIHFTGMNYPYGEHILFTDNQPVLAGLLHAIDRHLIPIGDHVVGIVNILMLVSLFIGGIYLFLILQYFKLPDWYAGLFSILIVFLSPQVLRMQFHYSLVYSFFFPGIWYYLLLIFGGKSKWWMYFGLVILFTVSAFVHMYYLAMHTMFVVGFLLFAWLFEGRRISRLAVLRVLGMIVVVAGAVILWIGWTDAVHDRPVTPYGIDRNIATFRSVFLPPFGPVFSYLGLSKQQVEGVAYVGIFGLLFLFSFLFYLVRYYKGTVIRDVADMKWLYISLFSGVVMLLFSMHFFYLIDRGGWLGHLSFFRQLRSIGRFAWGFYYTYLVFAVVYLYRFFDWALEKESNNLAYLVLLPIIIIWSGEAKWNVKKGTQFIQPNTFLIDSNHKYSSALHKAGKSKHDFQAILHLPMVAIGPEVFNIDYGGWTFWHSLSCSHELGIPIVNIHMSRTSLKEGLDLLALLGDLPIHKTRLEAMDRRPLLLVVSKEGVRGVEQGILSKARSIGKVDGVYLFELPLEQLKYNVQEWRERYPFSGDTVVLEGPPGYYWMNSVDGPHSKVFFNTLHAEAVSDTTLFCVDIPRDTQFYELSLWVFLHPKQGKQARIFNDYVDSAGKVHTQELFIEDVTDTKGYWVRYHVSVDSDMKHCIRVEGKALVDAFLVRPLHGHVIECKEGSVLFDQCPL